MPVFSFNRKKQGFSPLRDTDGDNEEAISRKPAHPNRTWPVISVSFTALAFALLTGAIGYILGSKDRHEMFNNGLLGKISSRRIKSLLICLLAESSGTIPTQMVWNSSFSKTAHSKRMEAWNSLYPGK
jgi:hypothetical protein